MHNFIFNLDTWLSSHYLWYIMCTVCIVIVTIEKDENESYWSELWFHEIFRRVLRNMDI